jgi:hypothetical protein
VRSNRATHRGPGSRPARYWSVAMRRGSGLTVATSRSGSPPSGAICGCITVAVAGGTTGLTRERGVQRMRAVSTGRSFACNACRAAWGVLRMRVNPR